MHSSCLTVNYCQLSWIILYVLKINNLFVLIFYVLVNIFSAMSGRVYYWLFEINLLFIRFRIYETLLLDCTADRRQSKTSFTIDDADQKCKKECFWLPFVASLRKIAIKNSVSKYFWSTFVDSINVFRLPPIRRWLCLLNFISSTGLKV